MAVAMEFEYTFGEVAVAKVLFFQEKVDDRGEVSAVHVVAEICMVLFHASDEIVEEGEGTDFLDELFNGRVLLLDVVVEAEVGGGKGVEILEHAGGCTGGWYKFEDFLSSRGLLIGRNVVVDGVVIHTHDAAIFDSGGINKFCFGETFAEVLNLGSYSLLGQAEVGNLFEVGI